MKQTLQRVFVKGVITNLHDRDDMHGFLQRPLVDRLAAQGRVSFIPRDFHYDLAKDATYFGQLHDVGRRLLAQRGARTLTDLTASWSTKQQAFFDHTFDRFFHVQASNKARLGSQDATFARNCSLGLEA
jgi:hypothetical protein